MRAIAAASFVLVLAGVQTTSAAPMTTYRDAKITAQVPTGWKVQVNHKAGLLMAQKNPRSKTSPTVMVAMTAYKRGTTAKAVLTRAVNGMGGRFRVINRQVEQKGNAIQVVGQLTKDGLTIQVAALSMVSPMQGRTIFAAFMALRPAFYRHGGMKLLHKVTFSVRPARAAVATRRAPPRKPGYTSLARGGLRGSWQQVGIGGMMNRTDMYGRVTSTDMRGSGTHYKFSRNRYTVIYSAKMRSGFCRSQANMVEEGRYTYNGTTLRLRPTGYSGDICTCCNGRNKTRVRKKRIPNRSYRVFGIAGKRALVLRGKCAPYMVDSGCSSTQALIKGAKHDLIRDYRLLAK